MSHASNGAMTAFVPFRLYLLGSFRLECDGKPVHFPRRKVEALLAYLTLYPQVHSREKLAALFWGDFTDAQARKSLRTALPILRKQLGDDLLLSDRESVQLNPAFPLWVDAREFEKEATAFLSSGSPDPLQMNIDLYRGELLADFYDDWVLPERERFGALYLKTLTGLVQLYRAQSEYERAIELAQKILATDNADEPAHQHLMFCYVAVGNRQAALDQYDRCVRALSAELDVEPSPETTALANWIRQSTLAPLSTTARLTNLPIPLSSFIGRKREITEIKRLLMTARLVTCTGAGAARPASRFKSLPNCWIHFKKVSGGWI